MQNGTKYNHKKKNANDAALLRCLICQGCHPSTFCTHFFLLVGVTGWTRSQKSTPWTGCQSITRPAQQTDKQTRLISQTCLALNYFSWSIPKTEKKMEKTPWCMWVHTDRPHCDVTIMHMNMNKRLKVVSRHTKTSSFHFNLKLNE